MDRPLLILGTVLFLGGLLVGAAVGAFRNRRMALSAHLVGVQHGMVLWILPVVAGYADLSAVQQYWFGGLAAYGLGAIWFAMLLAAVWGASRALPMAGAGYTAAPAQELTVQALILTGAAATIGAIGLLLYCLLNA
ncbi:MAG: hydroxylaminobenzene mutase [Gammaproteobacteria bacterium]|nr:hydroxylaminobenzene mutase [Gammaproteobacteria bacterium]